MLGPQMAETPEVDGNTLVTGMAIVRIPVMWWSDMKFDHWPYFKNRYQQTIIMNLEHPIKALWLQSDECDVTCHCFLSIVFRLKKFKDLIQWLPHFLAMQDVACFLWNQWLHDHHKKSLRCRTILRRTHHWKLNSHLATWKASFKHNKTKLSYIYNTICASLIVYWIQTVRMKNNMDLKSRTCKDSYGLLDSFWSLIKYNYA